jgi:dTDP-4-amino-4,6-dideoxygalactose transaminase
VLVENRDKVMTDLNEKGIGAGSHYPIPCHLQNGYKPFIKIGSELNVSENISAKLLSLPLDESLSSEQIKYVCEELVKSIKSNA